MATSPSLRSAPKPRYFLMAFVVLLTLGMAVTWSLIAQRELAASLVLEPADRLDNAKLAFETTRARTQTSLQGFARILVEDPRLKATLATENIDAATVADILNDLGKLRGTGFFMVLSPDGRVFAEAGAKELQGLDLSGSSIVKRAQAEPTAASGAWVLGDKVMDLSIMAIRYGEELIAYLAVGQAIEETDVQALSKQCGCEVATALGGKLVVSSSKDAAVNQLLTTMASTVGSTRAQVLSAGSARYTTSSFDLGDVAQSHRLLLASPLDRTSSAFVRLGWLLWVPPGLMFVAVLFALSANRARRYS